jgi:hypothetical protein
MFEDWKQAWRQAVENFQREAGVAGAPPRIRAMERELTSASGALLKLDAEIARTARDHEREREAEQVSRRRGGMAREVGDDETHRIAEEFAARHGERAAVLERKLSVLRDERSLLARDVDAMRTRLAEVTASSADALGAAPSDRPGVTGSAERDRAGDVEFSRMERERRERAAAERLEELKRRMRG